MIGNESGNIWDHPECSCVSQRRSACLYKPKKPRKCILMLPGHYFRKSLLPTSLGMCSNYTKLKPAKTYR